MRNGRICEIFCVFDSHDSDESCEREAVAELDHLERERGEEELSNQDKRKLRAPLVRMNDREFYGRVIAPTPSTQRGEQEEYEEFMWIFFSLGGGGEKAALICEIRMDVARDVRPVLNSSGVMTFFVILFLQNCKICC